MFASRSLLFGLVIFYVFIYFDSKLTARPKGDNKKTQFVRYIEPYLPFNHINVLAQRQTDTYKTAEGKSYEILNFTLVSCLKIDIGLQID